MAVFRVEKKRDYIVMSNYHLRDKTLSLKAKGLLSLMLSLPENWDYTLAGLVSICREEIGAVSSGFKELEAHGYLERITVRNDKGQFQDTDYMIYEISQKTPEEIIDLKSAKKKAAAKSNNPKSTKPSMNEPIKDKPISKKVEII